MHAGQHTRRALCVPCRPLVTFAVWSLGSKRSRYDFVICTMPAERDRRREGLRPSHRHKQAVLRRAKALRRALAVLLLVLDDHEVNLLETAVVLDRVAVAGPLVAIDATQLPLLVLRAGAVRASRDTLAATFAARNTRWTARRAAERGRGSGSSHRLPPYLAFLAEDPQGIARLGRHEARWSP